MFKLEFQKAKKMILIFSLILVALQIGAFVGRHHFMEVINRQIVILKGIKSMPPVITPNILKLAKIMSGGSDKAYFWGQWLMHNLYLFFLMVFVFLASGTFIGGLEHKSFYFSLNYLSRREVLANKLKVSLLGMAIMMAVNILTSLILMAAFHWHLPVFFMLNAYFQIMAGVWLYYLIFVYISLVATNRPLIFLLAALISIAQTTVMQLWFDVFPWKWGSGYASLVEGNAGLAGWLVWSLVSVGLMLIIRRRWEKMDL